VGSDVIHKVFSMSLSRAVIAVTSSGFMMPFNLLLIFNAKLMSLKLQMVKTLLVLQLQIFI
jgi:hypothetical protein